MTYDDDYVGKKPCPKCGSKDNVYRYPDGHEFCFGRCGYMKPAPLTKDAICALVKEKADYDRKLVSTTMYKLPDYADDASARLENPGLTWIKKYGIFNDELEGNDILWSKSQEQLIFPIYGANYTLIAWQARNFKPDRAKYVTFGKMNEVLHILGLTKHEKSDILIVEDIVSAIKVSRHFRSMPLFGSGCSKEKLTRLRRYTDSVKFWLDRDKYGEAMKLSRVATQLGFKATAIFTEKDPKDLFDQEILQIGTV